MCERGQHKYLTNAPTAKIGNIISKKRETITMVSTDSGLARLAAIAIRTAIINKGSQGDRVYSIKAKVICLNAQSGGTAGNGNMLIEELSSYRKLTPIECERLQTVPDNYTNYVSNSQRYKMLGNGWTVDVIAHIFKGLK